MRNLDKRGFTLLELIVVISIIGMVITTIFSLLFFGYDVFGMTSRDFEVQSDVRLAMEELSTTVRASKAVFAVPDVQYKDEQWNYIAVSADQTMVIDYQWDENLGTNGGWHENVVLGPSEGLRFEIEFSKINSMKKDAFMSVRLITKNEAGQMSRFDLFTSYDALNSLQVIDYGTELSPAKALAYRHDEFHYENKDIHVNIVLVLDTSGSMNETLSGSRRIAVLKEKSVDLVNQFGANYNDKVFINMAAAEYNTTANGEVAFKNVKSNEITTLRSQINNLCGSSNNCNGGTNIGDGLRRAYFALKQKTEQIKTANADKLEHIVIKNYVITLSDGVYTFFSRVYQSRYDYTFYLEDGDLPPLYLYYPRGWSWDYYFNTCDSGCNARYDSVDSVPNGRDDGGWLYYPGTTYVTGNGGSEDSRALEYIRSIGTLGLGENSKYTNYFIGFTPDVETRVINNIRDALNMSDDNVFSAANADELGVTFTNIQTSITNDTWHYMGPKLTD